MATKVQRIKAPTSIPDIVRASRRFATREETYRALAQETGALLIPFLLEGVAADPALNQADGIHPTAAGHRIVAETVWQALGPIL